MANPAARKSDPSSCPVPGHETNPIATGSPDVFFDGLPAARLTLITQAKQWQVHWTKS